MGVICYNTLLILLLSELCYSSEVQLNVNAPKPDLNNGGKPKPAMDKDELRQRRLADVEKMMDADGWNTVKALHGKMDDDHSGRVDVSEAEGFVREELDITEKDRVGRRQLQWSDGNDRMLTVDELWYKWYMCEERTWTVEQVIDWLENYIELPEYADIFRENNVEGGEFAKMAATDGKFLTFLGIMNPVHRHKLQLKAMDIVLFGFRHPKQLHLLELLASAMSALLVAGLVFYRWQKVTMDAQRVKFEAQLKQLEQLHVAHNQELASARAEINDRAEAAPHDAREVALLHQRLAEAERLLAANASAGVPLELLQLLHETRDVEMRRLHGQHKQNLEELRDVQEEVQRRQGSGGWLSVTKLAVGQHSAAEQLDNRITKIRIRMEQTKKEDVDAKKRWVRIFALCVPQTTAGSPANVVRPSVLSSAASGPRVSNGAAVQPQPAMTQSRSSALLTGAQHTSDNAAARPAFQLGVPLSSPDKRHSPSPFERGGDANGNAAAVRHDTRDDTSAGRKAPSSSTSAGDTVSLSSGSTNSKSALRLRNPFKKK